MARFEIETPKGRFEVEAPDMDTALRVLGGGQPESDTSKNLRSELSGITQGFDGQGGSSAMRTVDSAMRGYADMASFGLADEISAGLGAATGLGGDFGDFSGNLHRQRIEQELRDKDDPYSSLIGRLGGAIGTGVGLARGGLSLGANAMNAGSGLGRVAAASAADGMLAGGLYGAGSGEGMADRAWDATKGAAVGGLLGGAVPLATAGVGALAKPFYTPIMARLRPQDYAEKALATDLRRAGMTADDLGDALSRSRADGQDMFTVADAMGQTGARRLSSVVRTPNDSRQMVLDTLTQRQMGQGERLSRTVAEGFDASDTVAQRSSRLTAGRTADADVNYAAARQGAGAVNLNTTIDTIDALMKRNPILGDSALTKTEIGLRLARLRSQMRARGEQLVDFDIVLNLKQDLYGAMQALRNSGKSVPHELTKVYAELDAALESASKGYRAANDTFRAQSRAIDAIDTGRDAARASTRAPDNIATFGRMTPEEQAGHRVGYAEPLLARIEAASISPNTNKARMLMTEKSGQEFPVFAAPGRGDQMGSRIAREQRMFETSNRAMGGSQTAANLADDADTAGFTPEVLVNSLRKGPVAAAVDSVLRVVNEARGMPPQVLDRLALMLLETRPDVARALLKGAATRQAKLNGHRGIANAILINMGAVNASRAAGR